MRIVLLSRIWSSVPASASPATSAPLASANAPSVFDIEPMVSPPACPSLDGLETIRHPGRCDHRNPASVSEERLMARPKSRPTSKVVGIDHISIRVSDYQKSKTFYGRLFEFLGFEISDEYPNTVGLTNGKTRYWIAPAEGRKTYPIGDLGLHPQA